MDEREGLIVLSIGGRLSEISMNIKAIEDKLKDYANLSPVRETNYGNLKKGDRIFGADFRGDYFGIYELEVSGIKDEKVWVTGVGQVNAWCFCHVEQTRDIATHPIYPAFATIEMAKAWIVKCYLDDLASVLFKVCDGIASATTKN